MKTSRRDFVKNAGLGVAALNIFPNFNFLESSTIALPRKSPESQGVDSEGILNFLKAAKDSGLEWHSIMLLRHGNVVAEAWWKPFEAASKHTLYSLSKSFTSTAIGFLVDEGKTTVEDQVLKFFPEEAPATLSENLKAMKIKHLLTMNTGHDTDTMPAIRQKPNQVWVKSFLEHPVIHQPSTHFLYNTGATYMLSAIIYKVTGKTLEEYLQPRLFGPLNITGYDWEKSPQGINTAGYGLRVSTEDIAKLGQLYLQKGKWRGKQILSENWVNAATSKQTESQSGDNDWSQGYGYQFWKCKPGFFRGDGAYGQFCMIMPEQDAVLAITSESWNMQKSMDTVYKTILPAIKTGKLPENSKNLALLKKEISQLSLPTPKSKTTSPLADRYSDKFFEIEKNDFNITQIGLGLFADAGVLRINRGMGIEKIGFNWEAWKVNKNKTKNFFPVNTRTHIPSRIAATGTWLNDKTLQINFKFTDTIHGDKLTFKFDDGNMTLDLLSSISENTKAPENRKPLIGKLNV